MYLSKIDIADGFYRVWLRAGNIPKLGVVLPTTPGQPPIIAFPLTLPMGWVESPPSYFTVLTETACDLANAHLQVEATRHLLPTRRIDWKPWQLPHQLTSCPPRTLQAWSPVSDYVREVARQ